MRYHETVPSEPGLYLLDGTEALLFHSDGKWYGHAAREVFDVERFTPMLGPLPRWDEDFIALACEVAFARMMMALIGRRGQEYSAFIDRSAMVSATASPYYAGERSLSLSLYRDMERVTRELGGET